MAYVKTVWTTGDVITATLANHWETQYDAVLADKGIANGIAGLDASALISLANLPTTLAGKSADMVDGAHAGTAANNVLQLDASGLVPLANVPATLTGKDADTLDGQHAAAFPLLGITNQVVNLFLALNQRLDTRSVSLSYDTGGKLTGVTEKDGVTTVKTTTLTYDANGRVTTVTESVAGKTITTTLSYDANGNLTGVTRSVS